MADTTTPAAHAAHIEAQLDAVITAPELAARIVARDALRQVIAAQVWALEVAMREQRARASGVADLLDGEPWVPQAELDAALAKGVRLRHENQGLQAAVEVLTNEDGEQERLKAIEGRVKELDHWTPDDIAEELMGDDPTAGLEALIAYLLNGEPTTDGGAA